MAEDRGYAERKAQWDALHGEAGEVEIEVASRWMAEQYASWQTDHPEKYPMPEPSIEERATELAGSARRYIAEPTMRGSFPILHGPDASGKWIAVVTAFALPGLVVGYTARHPRVPQIVWRKET